MKLLLIDGYAMMFRSYYAVRFAPQHNGQNINAVYGCATTIMQGIEQFQPDYIVAAFDAPEKTFRHEQDENYKAQREKAPDEFIAQIPLVLDLVSAFGIPTYIMPGFEADDIIGTLAHKADLMGMKSFIMSGDLDFLQLVNENVSLARFGGKQQTIMGPAEAEEKIGLPPSKIIDFKAISGDSSDNYKGIPGIGPKGAVELLKAYGSLEGIYENLEALSPKQRIKFEDYKNEAFHCQSLATIKLDVPVDHCLLTASKYDYRGNEISQYLASLSLNSLSNRALKLNTKSEQTDDSEQKISAEKSPEKDENEQLSFF